MTERGERLRLTYTNMGEARKLAPTTIAEKTRRLLHSIATKSEFPGRTIELVPSRDYSLVFGRNDDELIFFLEHLEELGWLKREAENRLDKLYDHSRGMDRNQNPQSSEH